MFHICGFLRPSSPALAAGEIGRLNALLDGYLRVTNNSVVLTKPLKLYWFFNFYAFGVSFRLNADQLRRVGPLYQAPFTVGPAGLEMISYPFWRGEQAITFDADKEIWLETEQIAVIPQSGSPLGAIIFGDGNYTYPPGQVYTLRFTAPVAQLIGGWYTVEMAPFEPIPAGKYAVIGGCLDRWQQDSAVFAWRLQFQNQEWRPGAPSHKLADSPSPLEFRFGGLGLWGTFTESSVPRLQFISEGLVVGDEVNIYLDVVKLH
jgi:hypothetical protein